MAAKATHSTSNRRGFIQLRRGFTISGSSRRSLLRTRILQVPILSGRYNMTILSANRGEDFGLLPCFRGTVERAPDLPALCAGLVRSQMGLSIGTDSTVP